MKSSNETRPRSRPPREYQPRSSFQVLGVQGRTDSTLLLPGGNTIPFVYSLGIRSTVPFIRFIGGRKSQKIFSWAETISVEPGELVTVRNESAHTGDIFINSGPDPFAIPRRVTVPVALVAIDATTVGPAFPCDTRRAKAVYLGGLLAGNNIVTTTVTAISNTIEGTYQINAAIATEGTPLATVEQIVIIPPATAAPLIPLGAGAQITDTVQVLLDQVTFTAESNAAPSPVSRSGGVFYILEY